MMWREGHFTSESLGPQKSSPNSYCENNIKQILKREHSAKYPTGAAQNCQGHQSKQSLRN